MTRLPAEIARARAETDALFALVRPERLYERPIPERHRIAFYLGHLEAFDWNLLREPLGLASFQPRFDPLFAFGIDPVDHQGLPTDVPSDWPSVEEIVLYRRVAREKLDAAIPKSKVDPVLLQVALEHRLMHAETLVYMLHDLPYDAKRAPTAAPTDLAVAGDPGPVEIRAGEAVLGQTRADGGFGWDNEFEAHRVAVPAFEIDALPVTNGRYLAFVDAGGRAPGFWSRRDGQWWLRTMFAEIPLPLDWPAWVRQSDAVAYAAWAGGAIPTEAEWQRAAHGGPGELRAHPWGDAPPDASRGNFGFRAWDPTPVGAFAAGATPEGVLELAGNGWEWTATPFSPFPGFERFGFYPGYSADFFDGKHFVLFGGSPRTADRLVRRTFRNWFQADYPHVYAKFRCVRR